MEDLIELPCEGDVFFRETFGQFLELRDDIFPVEVGFRRGDQLHRFDGCGFHEQFAEVDEVSDLIVLADVRIFDGDGFGSGEVGAEDGAVGVPGVAIADREVAFREDRFFVWRAGGRRGNG